MLGGLSVYVPMLEEKNLPARNEQIAKMRAGGAPIRELTMTSCARQRDQSAAKKTPPPRGLINKLERFS